MGITSHLIAFVHEDTLVRVHLRVHMSDEGNTLRVFTFDHLDDFTHCQKNLPRRSFVAKTLAVSAANRARDEERSYVLDSEQLNVFGIDEVFKTFSLTALQALRNEITVSMGPSFNVSRSTSSSAFFATSSLTCLQALRNENTVSMGDPIETVFSFHFKQSGTSPQRTAIWLVQLVTS